MHFGGRIIPDSIVAKQLEKKTFRWPCVGYNWGQFSAARDDDLERDAHLLGKSGLCNSYIRLRAFSFFPALV